MQRVSNPITSFGSIVAIVAIFVWFYVAIKFYSNYKDTGKKQSQYFALAILFGGFSIVLLALELVTFQSFDAGTPWGTTYLGKEVFGGISSYDLGLYFGVLAAIVSGVSLFFFDVFSLSFFENKMKWVVIPGLLILIYVILYVTNWPVVQLSEGGTDYDITRDSEIETYMILLFSVPILMPVAVFLISAFQVRENTFNFRRSIVLSFFHVVIAVGYTIEIVGGTGILSAFARVLILIFPIGVRMTLNPNNFVKKIFGAPS